MNRAPRLLLAVILLSPTPFVKAQPQTAAGSAESRAFRKQRRREIQDEINRLERQVSGLRQQLVTERTAISEATRAIADERRKSAPNQRIIDRYEASIKTHTVTFEQARKSIDETTKKIADLNRESAKWA